MIKNINFYGIEENKQFLSELRNGIIEKSSDKRLIEKASKRNRTLDDKLIKGLIHGSRHCNIEQFNSIINYGLLCPEFIGGYEDWETFYHLDLFEIPLRINY